MEAQINITRDVISTISMPHERLQQTSAPASDLMYEFFFVICLQGIYFFEVSSA